MAQARLIAPWMKDVGNRNQRSAIYHCVSRVVGREFLLRRQEKEQFVRYMRLYEQFCGVRILSYCIMSNHFHLLVEIPPSCEQDLSNEALLERLSLLYDAEYVDMIRVRLEALASSTTEAGREAHTELRASFTKRMWNLGLFMKTLKQRFTSWYNRKHQRKGTLWEARYKSMLVEDGYAARMTAAYIDLNPVRAGMVVDPKDYRWSSYAEAVAGGQLARNGIMRVLSALDNDTEVDGWMKARDISKYDWRSVAGRYRVMLYEDGASFGDAEADAQRTRKKRKGFSQATVEREVEQEGSLSAASVLRCRSRYFIDSTVLGSQQWVNSVIENLKGDYLKESRKMGGSRPRDALKKSGLWSLRQLSEY